MSEQLKPDIYIDDSLQEQKIHPLLFQPLLENAFKYVGGDYNIVIHIEANKSGILFSVTNSLPEIDTVKKDNKKGIGIENLKRRLELLYPGKHRLEFKREDHTFYAALYIDTDGNKH